MITCDFSQVYKANSTFECQLTQSYQQANKKKKSRAFIDTCKKKKKAFNKIHHPFVTKKLRKLEIEGKFPKWIKKPLQKKKTLHVILHLIVRH